MSSKIDVINLALYKLAQSVVLPSLADQSKAADVMGRLWEPMRDLVLEARAWPFALKAQALAQSAQGAQPGWQYRYARPSDCVTIKAVTDAEGLRTVRTLSSFLEPEMARWGSGRWLYQWEESCGDDGTTINSDAEAPWLVYISRVEDVGRYSASFVNALAARLAAEAGPPLIGDAGLNNKNELLSEYLNALTDAGAHSYGQGSENSTMAGAAEMARG